MLLKRLNGLLLTSFLAASLNPLFADDSHPEVKEITVQPSATMEKLKEFFHFQKEVFMVGHKHRYLVLPMQEGIDIADEQLKDAFKKKDFVSLGQLVNNKEHEDDFVSAIKEGIKNTKETAGEIIDIPLKNLKDVPGAFKVDIAEATREYHSAVGTSPIAATTIYSAHAVYALTKAGVVMLIEVPVEFVGLTALTVLATPLMVTLQTARVGLKTIYISARGALLTSFAGAAVSYAFVTSLVNTLCVDGVMVCRAGQKAMRSIWETAVNKITVQYTIDSDFENQIKIANGFVEYLKLGQFDMEKAFSMKKGEYDVKVVSQDEFSTTIQLVSNQDQNRHLGFERKISFKVKAFEGKVAIKGSFGRFESEGYTLRSIHWSKEEGKNFFKSVIEGFIPLADHTHFMAHHSEL